MSERTKYVPDHTNRALEGLPSPAFDDSERVRALVRSFGRSVQELEDETYDLLHSSKLSEAKGKVLEQWGRVTGVQRGDLEQDDVYRKFIVGRILVRNSSGKTDQLIQLYETLTAPSTVQHWDLHPAAAHLTAYREEPLDSTQRRRIKRQMNDASPAGVRLVLSESTLSALKDERGGLQQGGFSRLI